MPEQIPPRWLRLTRSSSGTRRAALPFGLRLKVRARGYVFVLACESAPDPIAVTFEDRSGQVLAHGELDGPRTAVFIPKGAATLMLGPGDPAIRIGVYPRSKLGLKLQAFVNGRFGSQSLPKRWRTAGAAARDLRGAHGALLQGSAAHRQEQAVAYRQYRARYVEDFAGPVGADATPPLTFITIDPATPAQMAAAFQALRAQSDPHWQWRIGGGAADALPADARDSDPRVRRLPSGPGDAAAAFNAAVADAGDALVALLDAGGRPTRDAVAMIRAAFATHGDCAVLYTDEERLDADGTPLEGVFKPAFNRHLLRSVPYVGALCVIRAARLAAIGGARPGFGGAWAYDLLLRAVEPLPASAIRHIPRVAFSRPAAAGEALSAADLACAARAVAEVAGVETVQQAGGRLRPIYTVPEPAPLVSFVIPTRDRADLLGLALRSMIALTRYRAFEIIIVDNGSVEPETFALFAEIAALWPATRVVRDDGGFNYPRICNRGVDATRGSLICLLNNDIEVVEPGWLDEMVALASLPGTGIVGAKLLFPDRTIQHAGVIAGLFAYAGHWFAHAAADAGGYEDRLHSRQNLSAVTGACLMISRPCWDAIGPLDAARFAEDCNDIDLCLRAVAAGYELVWTPFACLIHHESASRGRRRAKAHRERLKAQRARFEALWHASTLVDPYYNPNLRRKSLYATLAGAPEGPRTARTASVTRSSVTPSSDQRS